MSSRQAQEEFSVAATPSAISVELPAPSMMSAVMQDRYGTTAVLANRNIARPAISETEVLIQVRAAGVNIADWAVMSGLPYIARPVYGVRRPKHAVRGTDVAGTVIAIGSAVTRFQPGDDVFGSADGSYAGYAAAAEDELAAKPTNLSHEQAAVSPMAGLVALQALRDVREGQKVLVNGASGGIGTFAVQIGKALGAHVTGVCSTRNVQLVRSLGADEVIDYTRENFTQTGQRYDLILDNVSNHSLSDLRRALAPTGTLIPNGGQFHNRWFSSAGRLMAGKVTFRSGGQQMRNFLVSMKAENLLALAELIESGKVTPVIDRTYPLSEAAEAISYVGSGRTRGKVAISV
jgi:NADPH:quinone reductase-like Zn-dependent oxidoreductase